MCHAVERLSTPTIYLWKNIYIARLNVPKYEKDDSEAVVDWSTVANTNVDFQKWAISNSSLNGQRSIIYNLHEKNKPWIRNDKFKIKLYNMFIRHAYPLILLHKV